MPGRYSNNFSDQGLAGGDTVFHPQVDHYNPGDLTWGDMVVGVSQPYFKGPAVSFSPADGGGLTLGVEKNPAAPTGPPTTPPTADSRPVNVLAATDGSNAKLINLSDSGTLTAEVEFDTPMAAPFVPTAGSKPLDYAWGLALNLRDGDGTSNETGAETKLRVSCQFFNGGYIHFHGTDYTDPHQSGDPVVETGTYASDDHTNFRLSMTVPRQVVGGAVKLSGTGELWVGPHKYSGNLKIPASITDISWAKVIGFSLVSPNNLLPGISIRVKRFTLAIAP